ncbi:PEP-CTERM sorting domain-containing protein [Calothrix sp. NIES-2098]|uniref:PEP-CTERM sorting domain-containing protein n=1 Tax=Calothrix sp. NIES-2098 TaxID=1954171 RepID=UPI000B5F5C0A|nr:hypothetical protein NIES2098_00760 [Calothrix sp. NIES-2098]
MNFKSIGLGITLTCGTLAVGNSLTMSPVQAFSLSGTVSLYGRADLGTNTSNPLSTAITWLKQPRVEEGTGDFFNLEDQPVTIKNLPLTLKAGEVAGNKNTYTFNAVTSFIDFGSYSLNGQTKKLTFDLDAGKLTRTIQTNGVEVGTVNNLPFGLSGKFLFGDETVATGSLSGNRSFLGSDSSGLTTISLTTQAVPEPLTILGSATALGFGTTLKKKYGKKQNKEKTTV